MQMLKLPGMHLARRIPKAWLGWMQMPYLLDLHLYLSRPLSPAPVQPLHQAAAAAAALSNDVSMFGTIPQVSIDDSDPASLDCMFGRTRFVEFLFRALASAVVGACPRERESGIQ